LQSLFDFFVCLVLAQRIDSPDRRWKSADQSELQHKANHASNGATNGEEGQPWKKQGNNQTHEVLQNAQGREMMSVQYYIFRRENNVAM